MKIIFTCFLLLLLQTTLKSQTLMLSGKCMTGTITLNKFGSMVDGKVAYLGTGTVLSTPNVEVSVYWIGAPDNVWVIAFSGQPYFANTCPSPTPPATANTGCTWTELAAGSCPGATPLTVAGTGTLPVGLVNFNARKNDQHILLSWKTAVEANNKGFEVERSTNGGIWTTIGFVTGAGTSNTEQLYQFEDVQPLKGKNFYRLKQVDLDNRSTYSNIVMADFSVNRLYTLQPLSNGNYQLNIEAPGKTEWALLDIAGRILYRQTGGQGVHNIDLRSYAPGTYFLQVKKDAERYTETLIKR